MDKKQTARPAPWQAGRARSRQFRSHEAGARPADPRDPREGFRKAWRLPDRQRDAQAWRAGDPQGLCRLRKKRPGIGTPRSTRGRRGQARQAL